MSGDGADSGEEDSFMDPVLALDAAAVGEYDANDLPINGHQYLHRVMKEADKLPDVVVAEVNRTNFQANQTFYVPEMEIFDIPPEYIPTEVWQALQVEDFERIRKRVSTLRSKLSTFPDYGIPDYEDEEEDWLAFWKSAPPEPALQYMLAFNQSSLDVLLNHLCSWLEANEVPFDSRTCLWVYSILACLEIPLLPSTFSSLRTLAQLAIKKRVEIVQSKSPSAAHYVTQLNLLVCIVGRYFKQTDLADKFRSAN